jgi:hypothetical protein
MLWYSVGTYSPVAAEASLKNSPCVSGTRSGGNCIDTPTVPILWSSPALVVSVSSAITSDALVADGSNLYAAVTFGTSTSVYASVNGGATWTVLASSITGTVGGLVANSTDVVVVTHSSFTYTSTVYTLSGTLVGASSALSPVGSGITGIPGVAFAVAPVGRIWQYALAIGATGPNTIQVATSSDGIHYSSFTDIGTFNTTVPSAAFSSIGATNLYPSGGNPGQVALAAIGSGMLLLYTTRVNGETSAYVLSSASGGSAWLGPYRVGSTPGSVVGPALTPSYDGTVYASWRDAANGTGTVVSAILAPNGGVVESPAAIPGSSEPDFSPISQPAIGVDAFQRALLVWPSKNYAASGQDLIAYSGGYLSPATAANQVEAVVSDPLVPADFDQGAPGNPSQTLSTDLSTDVSTIDTDISSAQEGHESGYCNSQNLTVLGLYANVTRIPLSYSNSGTVCASFSAAQLNPRTSLISPDLGPLAPNTYLATYADWALEAVGVTVTESPLQAAATALQAPQDGFSASPSNYFSPPTPVSASGSVDGEQESITVTPTVFSPTALELSVSSTPIPTFQSNSSVPCYLTWPGPKTGGQTDHFVTSAAKTWVNVSLDNGTSRPFTGTSAFVSSLFLTNLTPLNYGSTEYYWKATFSVAYAEIENITTFGTGCATAGNYPIYPAQPASLGPIVTNATFVTELAVYPGSTGSSFVREFYNAAISVGWINTDLASDTLGLVNDTTYIEPQSASEPDSASPAGYAFPNLGSEGDTYTLTLTATGQAGGWSSSEEPAFSAGTYGTSPVQTATDTCTFTLSPPSETLVSGSGSVTNITSNSATISWEGEVLSGTPGMGFVTYYAVGTGVNLTDNQANYTKAGLYEKYTLQLHGLDPWTSYSVTYGITTYPGGTTNGNCLSQTSQTTLPQFLTNETFGLWEQDQPYDSISHTGGGATIGWSLPAWFLAKDPTWVSGAVNYTNSSGVSVGLPLSPSEIATSSSNGFAITLQLGIPGTAYTANASLVYEIGTTKYYAFSPALSFVYLRDTSGDGLTDAEKIYGWSVTYQAVSGVWNNEPVWANPQLYGSNGLVSDYVEKEYGLNPSTLDTAGSHMLDTWNLTFQLTSSACPSEFHCWYENSTNPFSFNVDPAGLNPGGSPVESITTSIAHWTSGGLQDDNATDAEDLWSTSALYVLQNLSLNESVGWLRGVIMHNYDNKWTLTVWGKLSWGANPLAASTLNDGIADGSRLDPILTKDLTISVTNLYVTGLSGYSNYAARFRLYEGTTPTGTILLTNYSAPVGGHGNPGRLTEWQVAIPVSQASQYVTAQIALFVNETSSTGPLTPLLFNGARGYDANLTYDMVNGTPHAVTFSDANESSHPNGSISLTFDTAFAGSKDPTLLWFPTQNGTTNGLPAGLERYTGEQSFDLVLVNSSASFTSDLVPHPWGGSYSITLQPGLNNLLLPRNQFLSSPFGQAILLGQSTAPASNTSTPPILSEDSAARSLLTTDFGRSAGLTYELGAYWQNRSIVTSSGNFTVVSEKGTATSGGNPNPLNVSLALASSTLTNNTGGLAFDPSLYSGGGFSNPGALQAIVTLNITSQATLDLLLAALLDNTTGGVNGTLQSVTNFVGSLGLDPSVVGALANSAIVGQGLYGIPTYQGPPPSNSGNLWGDIVNSASDVVQTVASTFVSVTGVLWSATLAATVYLDRLAIEASSFGGRLLARAAATLVSLGRAIVSALEQLLDYVIQLIQAALAAVINPVCHTVDSTLAVYESTFESGSDGAVWSYLQQRGNGGPPANVTNDFGVYLLPLLISAGALTAILSVVLGIALPFDLGLSLLVGLATPLIVKALSGSSQPASPTPAQNSHILSAIHSQSGLTVSSLVETSATAFNGTEPNNTTAAIQPVGHPYPAVKWDWFAFLGAVIGLTDGIWGLVAAGVTSGTWSQLAGYIGATLGFAAMILCIVAMIQFASLPSSYNGSNWGPFQDLQSTDIWLADLAISGGTLCAFGAIADSDNPDALGVAGFGLFFSILGSALAFTELSWIHSNT